MNTIKICGKCKSALIKTVHVPGITNNFFGRRGADSFGNPLEITTEVCPNKKHWWDGHRKDVRDNDLHVW